MLALLRQGVLAGAIAGLLAGLVAFAIGEPALQHAIDLESGTPVTTTHVHGSTAQAAAGHDHHASGAASSGPVGGGGHDHGEEELVSRPWQRVGLLLASTLSGFVLGGILAVVFAVRQRRRSSEDPWAAALWLGAAGALAWVAFPLVLAPPNPPGVGDPSTITQRTVSYLCAVAGGLALAWLASRFVRALPADGPRWRPWLAVAVTIVGGTALLAAVLPAPVAPPADFPADLLWQFRLASVATQLTLWAVLSVGFASLVDRAMRPGARARDAAGREPAIA